MVTASTWTKAKRDYINGLGSYRDICKRYGMKLNTLAKKAKEENWIALREKQQNKTGTIIQQEFDKQSVEEGLRVMTMAKDLVVKELILLAGYVDNPDIDPSVAESVTRSTERVVKMLRDMFDAPTPEQAESRRIAAERLKLDIKKSEQEDEKDNTITVKFEAGPEEWNE